MHLCTVGPFPFSRATQSTALLAHAVLHQSSSMKRCSWCLPGYARRWTGDVNTQRYLAAVMAGIVKTHELTWVTLMLISWLGRCALEIWGIHRDFKHTVQPRWPKHQLVSRIVLALFQFQPSHKQPKLGQFLITKVLNQRIEVLEREKSLWEQKLRNLQGSPGRSCHAMDWRAVR